MLGSQKAIEVFSLGHPVYILFKKVYIRRRKRRKSCLSNFQAPWISEQCHWTRIRRRGCKPSYITEHMGSRKTNFAEAIPQSIDLDLDFNQMTRQENVHLII